MNRTVSWRCPHLTLNKREKSDYDILPSHFMVLQPWRCPQHIVLASLIALFCLRRSSPSIPWEHIPSRIASNANSTTSPNSHPYAWMPSQKWHLQFGTKACSHTVIIASHQHETLVADWCEQIQKGEQCGHVSCFLAREVILIAFPKMAHTFSYKATSSLLRKIKSASNHRKGR